MSGPLHLVRIGVDPVALRLFAEAEGVTDDDLGYALHLALRRRYGAAAPQPFRWPAPTSGAAERVLLGYAGDAAALRAADPRGQGARPAEAGLPDWTAAWDAADPVEAVFPDPVETKLMPGAWTLGQRLGFSLRARPVTRYGAAARRGRSEEGRRSAGERDAFLAAVEADGKDDPALSRDAVYLDWLRNRLAPAAEADTMRLTARRRMRVVRRRHAAERYASLEGPEAVAEGVLTVADPDAFDHLLRRGLGRHVAFGFGMLLLRPASA